jgi:hypothetical protein
MVIWDFKMLVYPMRRRLNSYMLRMLISYYSFLVSYRLLVTKEG